MLALCGVSFKDRVAARRTLEEREILKEKQKCQVHTNNMIIYYYIISYYYTLQCIEGEMPGVHEQPDGLRVPSLWPHDDLHLLWPQTCELSYLQKADCQGYKDIQGLSRAARKYIQCKYILYYTLHSLWPQTCQLSYLQKADRQGYKDLQGLSLAVDVQIYILTGC